MSYPEGDTYNNERCESGLPIKDINPVDPRGMMASPDFAIEAGQYRLESDRVTIRENAGGGNFVGGDGSVDGGTP